MNFFTKSGLNLMQKAGLERSVIALLNRPLLNDLMLKHCWQRKNYKYFFQKHLSWSEFLKKNSVSLKDKEIFEAGSGASMGLGYFFYGQGYRSWTAADKYQDLTSNNKRVIRNEIKLISKIASEFDGAILNQTRFFGKKINFGSKFNFIKMDLTEFRPELEGKFDFILSNFFLEHLEADDLAAVIKNLSGYLKTGGLMVHEIDLRDHINLANPHGFLKYSKADWDKLTRGTIFYTNRLGIKDYIEYFSKNKLIVKSLQTKEQPITERISECFYGYSAEELAIYNIFIILEKISDK